MSEAGVRNDDTTCGNGWNFSYKIHGGKLSWLKILVTNLNGYVGGGNRGAFSCVCRPDMPNESDLE